MWNPKYDIYKNFANTPDKELELWEKWTQIRENEVIRLGIKTNRPPADLVMHGCEYVRQKKEEKRVLEHAKIEKRSKLRGGAWEQSQRLKQRCPCENVYEVHKSPSEQGELKGLVQHHTGCPEYIQKHEKGLIGEPKKIQCTKLNASYEKYKQKREEDLKEKILKIDPFRPDIKNLIIIGKKPKPTTPKPLLPTIKYTVEPDHPFDALSEIYAIRINDTIFIKETPNTKCVHLKAMQKQPWHQSCLSWSYYFNTPESKIGRATMFMKNLGTVTLTYAWKKLVVPLPFTVPEEPQHRFFFYNGEDLICPGQSKTIVINFLSSTPGIYNEVWELVFENVNFFTNTSDKLTINLNGDCIENIKKTNKRIEKLQNGIERKTIRQLSFDLMNEAIDKALNVEHEIYPYKQYLLESEMFVMKNPDCFYHQTEVQVLKDLYTEMTEDQWDLSIVTWKAALITKDFEDRMRYYDLFKKSYRYLLRPWYEGDEVLLTKYRAVNLLLCKFLDKFHDEEMRVSKWNGKFTPTKKDFVAPIMNFTPLTPNIIKNIFYIRMFEHLSNTIEQMAGIISSLDLNRWIEFDFCHY